MKGTSVHRAKWVYPASRPLIEDGAVVIRDNQILEVGEWSQVKKGVFDSICDHGESILMPGLVNVHAHLELSAFKNLGQEENKGGFIQWVRRLLSTREKVTRKEIDKSYREALSAIVDYGTMGVGDVGNDSSRFFKLLKYNITGCFFLEVLGFAAKNVKEVLPDDERLQSISKVSRKSDDTSVSFRLAAHAAYSTSPSVIRQVKRWNKERCEKMSIHVAEHPEELEFLKTGKGPCRELLEERGQWNPDWSVPKCSPVEYLEKLEVLDESTVCVHVVFVSEGDLDILKKRGVPIAICPRSNLFMTGQLPPVARFIERNLTCGIGTDSLASNTSLNLFEEMSVLENELKIDPEVILKLSTTGGAKLLGIGKYVGSLDSGKIGRMLKISISVASQSEVFSEVISKGQKGVIQWVS